MAERMTDERLAEIEQHWVQDGNLQASDEDDALYELLQALKAERQEVEKLSNGYACPICGGYPGPEDNCACGGSGHIADAYDYLRKDHIRLEQEVERLRKNDELQMNRAIAAERKLARLVDDLEPVHKAEILAALDEDDSLTFVSYDELCVKLDEATGEGK